MRPVVLIVVNDAGFFLSHRVAIAEAAQGEGYEVHVASQEGSAVKEVVERGFRHHTLALSRSGKNPFSELRTLFSLWVLCWRLRPDVLHLVTIKPVLYGGIVARFAPVKGVLAAISGLGFVFMAQGRRAKLLRMAIAVMYRAALAKRNLRAVFQNPDDRDALAGIGAITSKKSILIRGSGVDLQAYVPQPEAPGVPVVTLGARLLRDKGVFEFVQAAEILSYRGVHAQFQLVGDIDPGNPTSVSAGDLEEWSARGIVKCMGYQSDMISVFQRSHVVVLPSYREGLPKVLIEAAACGRAVVTTDVPGCRDAIESGITGLLVPVQDAIALADAIQRLVEDSMLRQQMGRAGRELAERAFAIESIVAQHLDIYKLLEKSA
jgi:glycosyltransferase involved in cell wall biosynthesis